MLIECKKCGNRIDPNSEDTKWEPPHNPFQDIGSIRCPNCDNSADFSEWKLISESKPEARTG